MTARAHACVMKPMAVRLMTLAFNSGQHEEMVNFYRALGAKLEVKQVNKGTQSYQGTLGELEITIYCFEKRDPAFTPNFSMRFTVDEIDAIMTRLHAVAGASVIMDIEMMTDGKKAIVLDPDGHSIELIQAWSET